MFDQLLEKILDYKGNRYELARACMEYAKCVRYLNKEETGSQANAKEVLIAIQDVLDNKIKYTSDKFQIEIHQDEVEFMKNFKSLEEPQTADTETLPDADSSLLKTTSPVEADESNEENEEEVPYANPEVLAKNKPDEALETETAE